LLVSATFLIRSKRAIKILPSLDFILVHRMIFIRSRSALSLIVSVINITKVTSVQWCKKAWQSCLFAKNVNKFVEGTKSLWSLRRLCAISHSCLKASTGMTSSKNYFVWNAIKKIW